jgi:hypothetical protein
MKLMTVLGILTAAAGELWGCSANLEPLPPSDDLRCFFVMRVPCGFQDARKVQMCNIKYAGCMPVLMLPQDA